MNKYFVMLVGLLLCCSPLPAQEKIHETHFQGKTISGLRGEGWWQITVRQGEQTGVQLEADARLKPYLICSLQDQVLKLSFKELPKNLKIEGSGNSGKQHRENKTALDCPRPTVIVTLSSLEKLVLSGVCRLKAEDTLTAQNCKIVVNGVTTIANLPLRVKNLDLNQSGVSNIRGLNVQATGNIRLDRSGVSKLSETTIHTPGHLTLDVSGVCSGTMRVNVGELTLDASGVSKINLSGSVAKSHISQSGVCKVNISELLQKFDPAERQVH